jgi:NAD(P)-dependent dehydrogenase (short-subunit alcohol dehydrogenase family)
MDLGLRDRCVLVTGATTNIGAATATAFGREGARVMLTYHRRREAAQKVAQTVQEAGGVASIVPFALADPHSAAAAVDAVVNEWGALDVLVNNAAPRPGSATGPGAAALFEHADSWAGVLDANLNGPLRLTRYALPPLRRSDAGRIVNVSSVLAVRGAAGSTAMAAAKAGLHGATRALAWELGPDGLLVNVVMPGIVLDGKDEPVPLPEAVLEQARMETPIGRFPLAAHVANVIVFLGSSGNLSMTGEIIRVTGGLA